MFNEINVKLSYNIDNTTKTGDLKLRANDTLETALNKYKDIKSIKNKLKQSEFYLNKHKPILLDKKAKIKELNLKEGDLIVLYFKDNNYNSENTQTQVSPIESTGNINPDTNSEQTIKETAKPRKKFLIVIIITIALIIIGIIIFLIIHFKNKNKKNNGETKDINIDNKDDDSNNDDDNNNSNNDNNNNNVGNENNPGNNILPKKEYKIEELITKKRPYYPNNMLFLYKSDKSMSVQLESELNRENDESNMTNVKEFMDFGLIIRGTDKEIFEEEGEERKWFTGYITLLNLTLNNGTHDMTLNFNEELYKLINENNKSNLMHLRHLRKLNESTDSIALNNETEICFVKINFYENGEIKDIFYPEEFNINNMVYINTITKLIIPKLSKKLYSKNITKEIESINKLFERPDYYEEEYKNSSSNQYEQ